MKFNVDLYNGIIYEKERENDLSKYDLKQVREWRMENFRHSLTSGMDHVDTIQINPCGLNCFSKCDYCANCSTNYGNDVSILSPENLRNKIKELKNILKINRNPIEIVFSGGDFMIHPNIKSLVDIIFEEFVESINFGWCISGLHSKEKAIEFLQVIDYVDHNERTFKNSIYFTVDLDGSNYRKSLIYENIDNKSSIHLAHEFCEHVCKLDKTNIIICSKISNMFNAETNFKHYDDFLNKYNNNKVMIRCGIIDGYYKNIVPTSDIVNEYFDKLLEKYNAYYQSRGAYTFFISNKNENVFSNFGGYSLYLTELENGIYANHPFDLPCWSYIRFIGIDDDGYFPCPFGFDHTKDINDIISVKNFMEIEEVNNWVSGECSHCEIMPFCKLCKKISCSKLPFRKTYMKNLINLMLSSSDRWCILPNIMKENNV